jgi:hypothetical protein
MSVILFKFFFGSGAENAIPAHCLVRTNCDTLGCTEPCTRRSFPSRFLLLAAIGPLADNHTMNPWIGVGAIAGR